MTHLPVDGQVCEPDVGAARLVTVTAADPAASICPNKQDRVEWSVSGVIAVLATSHSTSHKPSCYFRHFLIGFNMWTQTKSKLYMTPESEVSSATNTWTMIG